MKKLLTMAALVIFCQSANCQTTDSVCVCKEKDMRIGPGQVKQSGNYRKVNDSTVVSHWGKVYVRRGRWYEFVMYCPEAKW